MLFNLKKIFYFLMFIFLSSSSFLSFASSSSLSFASSSENFSEVFEFEEDPAFIFPWLQSKENQTQLNMQFQTLMEKMNHFLLALQVQPLLQHHILMPVQAQIPQLQKIQKIQAQLAMLQLPQIPLGELQFDQIEQLQQMQQQIQQEVQNALEQINQQFLQIEHQLLLQIHVGLLKIQNKF